MGLLRTFIASMLAAGALAIGLPSPQVSAEEGDRFLRDYAATFRYTLGHPTGFRVTRDGDAVLYVRSGPRSFVRDLYELDTATGQERKLASAEQLLAGGQEQLSVEELARRERMRMAARGIADFQLNHDGRLVLVPLSGSLYVLQRATGAVREYPSDAGFPVDPQFSPTGDMLACVRDGNLRVIDLASGSERPLTHDASSTLSHGTAEFVAQEEMNRMHGYWWSPDGRHIACQETDTSQVEVWQIADPTRPDKAPTEWRYPRPGRNNARVRLAVRPVEGGEPTWVAWDRERYPYLASVQWKANAPLTILVQNREQTEQVLYAVDPQSGEVRPLLVEKDEAWLNLDDSMPRWLSDGRHFLWSSERSGHWQVELRANDGTLVRPLTDPALNYRRLLGVDESNDALVVAAGEDPTETHLYRVALSGKAASPRRITETAGIHAAVFAESGRVEVRSSSTLAGPTVHEVFRVTPGFLPRDANAKQSVASGTSAEHQSVAKIPSQAATPPFVPKVELLEVGGERRYRASIVRPRNQQPGRRYPVIVNVYGGPHSQMVQANGTRYLLNQWFADQGFLVVSLDGRGTPARGRAWERAIRGNLIDVPLQDQVEGLQALGKQLPELDLERVGIYGWSFGGYFSAMAAMQRPDIFDAGVAGAPVVDWQDYDTHYTERYLGLPDRNAEGYRASSVLTHASRLEKPLLVIHGTADDNVYFLHSVKLSDALFRAGKTHEFLPLAGFTHMVPDPLVTERLYRRIADFFIEHLQSP